MINKISFKYHFILSFVVLETLFLAMIALVNFNTIDTNAQRYIDEKTSSLKTMGNKLLSTPLSVYDLATIDDIIEELNRLENIVEVKVWDSQNRLVAQSGGYEGDREFIQDISKEIRLEGVVVGKFSILFSTKNIKDMINENKNTTLIIIFAEIFLSMIISWIIGHNLSRMLITLTEHSKNLSKNLHSSIPPMDGSKEIVVLSSTFESMRKSILQDRYTLNKYQEIIDDNTIISRTDLSGKITYVSNAFCVSSGYTKGELIGKFHRILRHQETSKDTYKNLWKTISKGYTWNGEFRNIKKDGTVYWLYSTIAPWIDEYGDTTGYIAISQDITDKKNVEKLSITDKLTQLYNRVKIEEIFNIEIQRSFRYKNIFSMLIIDIDYFKDVNDTYGHNIGDETLRDMADILKANVRKSDIVGRWGGEEFIVILPETELPNALEFAQKIRKAVEQHKFNVIGSKTISVGVSSFIENDTQETLVKRADDALYKAKESGRNKVVTIEDL